MSNEPEVGWWHDWTLADRLRISRERVAKSQEEFAALSTISKGTISNYENGKPTTKLYLVRWAEKTGCSLHWLLTGEPPEPPTNGGNVVELGKKKDRGLPLDASGWKHRVAWAALTHAA